MKPTHPVHPHQATPTLYMALELSKSKWDLAFAIGRTQPPRRRSIDARDLQQLQDEIRTTKRLFQLDDAARVVSCYEAGPDGFWIDRFLNSVGVENRMVDSASIEVNRRRRRAKTDRLDVLKLLAMLIRHEEGEPYVWSVVRIPAPADEDARQLHREMIQLKRERTAHINRLKGLLLNVGLVWEIDKFLPQRLEAARLWDGSNFPPHLRQRLLREFDRLQRLERQIRELEQERVLQVRDEKPCPTIEKVQLLMMLKGVGLNSAWMLVMEMFSWREFRNRREVAAAAGLAPTPYRSGQSAQSM